MEVKRKHQLLAMEGVRGLIDVLSRGWLCLSYHIISYNNIVYLSSHLILSCVDVEITVV